MSYPSIFATPGMRDFAESVDDERRRQIEKWGDQKHPDGTGRPGDKGLAEAYKDICQANGPAADNWRDILAEEVFEAFAETDPERLIEELIQTAAVIQAWVHHIKSRIARG
jgi:hypothetical protein